MCSTELKYISLTLIAEHGASVSPGSGQVQDMEVTRSKEGHQVGGCLNFTFLASAVAEAWIASDLGGDEYVMLRMRPDALRKLKPLDKAIKREEMMGISRIPEIEDKRELRKRIRIRTKVRKKRTIWEHCLLIGFTNLLEGFRTAYRGFENPFDRVYKPSVEGFHNPSTAGFRTPYRGSKTLGDQSPL